MAGGVALAHTRRDQPKHFNGAVHTLFVTPEHYWMPVYRKKTDRVREHTLALLTKICATLTPA